MTTTKQRKKNLNGYICFYRGKQKEIYANTSYEAQEKAAISFKAKKSYQITVLLAKKDGKLVCHNADF